MKIQWTERPGSYTVEATWIMAIVLFSIISMLRFAYGLHDETKGSMILMESIERARHGEGLDMESICQDGLQNAGAMYSFQSYDLKISTKKKHVTGIASGGKWGLEVTRTVYNPEGFLRMWALLETISGGNEQSE